VLTHGRGTEVHAQLVQLAEQLHRDYLKSGPRRLLEVHAARHSRDMRRRQEYLLRAAAMPQGCLLCDSALSAGDSTCFYVENGPASQAGFVHGSCWSEAVFRQVYNSRKEPDPALIELFLESARRSCFALAEVAPETSAAPVFFRLDEQGEPLSSRRITDDGQTTIPANGVFRLWNELNGSLPATLPRLLFCQRVSDEGPAGILDHAAYQQFQNCKQRFSARLSTPHAPSKQHALLTG